MREAEAEEKFRNVKNTFENLVKDTEKKTGPITKCWNCCHLIHEYPCSHCGSSNSKLIIEKGES
jgi:hypothetical protein